MTFWQLVFGVVLVAHGIGHVMGVLPLYMHVTDSWNTRSWLLTERLGEAATSAIAVVLWLVCLVGFVVAGLAVMDILVPMDWWRPLALLFSLMSLGTLAVFWNGLPFLVPNKVGAIAVDLVMIIGITLASWPTDEMLGS